MQHVRPSPRLQSRSDPARLEFRWEHFSDISREIAPLWRRHWEEIALDQEFIPLDPDWDSYFDLALRGVLHVLTARTVAVERSPLVGYIFNLIGGHQHYLGTRFAHTEMFWLDPDWRKGWQPVRMFLENLAGLKAREAEVATINFKLHFKNARVGKLLARLGYEPTDIVMRKVL